MHAMHEHPFEVTWVYVVPPSNDVRVEITQRKDGPYQEDRVGGDGNYYVSIQELVRGQWRHVDGSTSGGYRTYRAALTQAEVQWDYERGRLQGKDARPINMILHCPECGKQHIDQAAGNPLGRTDEKAWDNPPHKTHLCHYCGYRWRPADVPTNGVAGIATRGKDDS